MKADTQLNPDIPHEGYVPMTCVEKEMRFVSRSIPTKNFQLHINSIYHLELEKIRYFQLNI